MMFVDPDYMPLVRIDWPELFQDGAFIAWLNREDLIHASWHAKGEPPNEYSDLFMTYARGEGSEADMPAHIWQRLCAQIEALGPRYEECLIWLANVESGSTGERGPGPDPVPDGEALAWPVDPTGAPAPAVPGTNP